MVLSTKSVKRILSLRWTIFCILSFLSCFDIGERTKVDQLEQSPNTAPDEKQATRHQYIHCLSINGNYEYIHEIVAQERLQIRGCI